MGQITSELSAVGIARRINMYRIREVLHSILKSYLLPTSSLVIRRKEEESNYFDLHRKHHVLKYF